MSVPDFIDYRDQTHSFVGMAQIQDRNSANLSIAGAEPKRLNSANVGAQFFDLLGVPMELGRGFSTARTRTARSASWCCRTNCGATTSPPTRTSSDARSR